MKCKNCFFNQNKICRVNGKSILQKCPAIDIYKLKDEKGIFPSNLQKFSDEAKKFGK